MTEEDEILYEFVESGVIKGQFVRQFPVGIQRLTDKYRGTAKNEGELNVLIGAHCKYQMLFVLLKQKKTGTLVLVS